MLLKKESQWSSCKKACFAQLFDLEEILICQIYKNIYSKALIYEINPHSLVNMSNWRKLHSILQIASAKKVAKQLKRHNTYFSNGATQFYVYMYNLSLVCSN